MAIAKTILLSLLSVLISLSSVAQHKSGMGDKINALILNDTIVDAAIDRTGDFYAVTNTGQIQRFNQNGKLTLLYKAEQRPTIFDPRDGARLFVYYRNDQAYQFLNPSFNPLASYKIDSTFAIQPWLICPSAEYKLWILDAADQRLKKINVRAAAVEVEVAVDVAVTGNVESFKTMREYQNFVFLLNPAEGIFIFNSLGNHIKTVGPPPIDNFNFIGEELYYLQGSTVYLFNLFTAQVRRIEIDPGYSDVLLTDERMILFTRKAIDIFAFRP